MGIMEYYKRHCMDHNKKYEDGGNTNNTEELLNTITIKKLQNEIERLTEELRRLKHIIAYLESRLEI